MNGLIILIFVLQVILIMWAIGITILYAQLVRTVKRVVKTDSRSITALLDCNTWMTQLIKETVDATDALHNLVLDYTEKMNGELEKNEANKKFALDTIQEARRLYNSIQANIAPEVIEEEENNE